MRTECYCLWINCPCLLHLVCFSRDNIIQPMGVNEEGKLVPMSGLGENSLDDEAKPETEKDGEADEEDWNIWVFICACQGINSCFNSVDDPKDKVTEQAILTVTKLNKRREMLLLYSFFFWIHPHNMQCRAAFTLVWVKNEIPSVL